MSPPSPPGIAAMARAFDPSIFDALLEDLPAEKPLATFTKRLRLRLRDEEPEPFDHLDLATTLEIMMKVARFRLEVAAPTLAAIDASEGNARLDLATALCDELLSLVVWLGRLQAPRWLMHRLEASSIFGARASACLAMGDGPGSIHWSVGVVALAATPLRALPGAQIPEARTAMDVLAGGTSAEHARRVRDSFEAWNDLLASYALYDDGR